MKRIFKMVKTIFIILMLIFICCISQKSYVKPVSNEINTYKDYKYIIDHGSVTIIKYEGREKEVNIPDEINGLKVNKIDNYCFYENSSMESVKIPESITEINTNAFAKCKNLSNISLPNNLKSISSYTFYNCKNLNEINIPESVEEINEGAFMGDKNLKYIFISKNLKIIGDSAFANCKNLNSITLSDKIESIGENVFLNCNNLKVYGKLNTYTKDKLIENKVIYKEYSIDVVPLKINKVDSDLKSPQTIDRKIFLTIEAEGIGELKYAYEIKDNNGKRVVNKEFSNESKYLWNPNVIGTYTLIFKVKDETGKEVQKTMLYEINEELKVTTTKVDKSSPQNIGTSIKLSMSSTGGVGMHKYRFVAVKSDGTKPFIRDFSTSNTATWTPTEAGKYTLYFKVKDETGKEVQTSINYVITNDPQITKISTSVGSPQNVGTSIKLSMETTGGVGTNKYRFVAVKSDGTKPFARDFSTSNTATWTPTEAGTYTLYFKVNDDNKKDIYKMMKYVITEKPEITKISTSIASPQNVGTSINLSMSSTGGVGTHKYRFVAMKNNQTRTFARDYEENNTATWTPKEAGSYTLYFKVRDETGKEVQQIINYVVTNNPVITKIGTSVASPQNVGTSIKLSMETTGGVGTNKYRFVAVKSDGTKPFARDFSTSNTATWTPTEAGTYTLYFKVNDDNKKDIYKMMKYVITEKPEITKISTSVASPQKVGTSIKLNMTTKGGAGTLKYRFVAVKSDGTKTFIRPYETSSSTTWTPTEPGNYALYFKAIDSTGTEISKRINYIVDSYITKLNEDNSKIVYSGKWSVAKSETATNGTMKYTSNKGASAKMVFTGTGIVLKGVKGPERGIVKVTVDDKSYYIDLYNDTYVYNKVVFEDKNLSLGTHTITVECTGEYKDHEQSIKSTKIAIDGFEVVNGDIK